MKAKITFFEYKNRLQSSFVLRNIDFTIPAGDPARRDLLPAHEAAHRQQEQTKRGERLGTHVARNRSLYLLANAYEG